MRLFHYSDTPDIACFEPRPVRVPSRRAPGREWLNGPLVWAIDDWHQPMYLFPRDCPRILVWPTSSTTPDDLATWWKGRNCRMLAYVEQAWLEPLRSARLFRYEFPVDAFECLDDAGMWVSHSAVKPISVEVIDDLLASLAASDIELNALPGLAPLRDVWSTSLHASGIRLRNAVGWSEGATT